MLGKNIESFFRCLDSSERRPEISTVLHIEIGDYIQDDLRDELYGEICWEITYNLETEGNHQC